ncbi:MAG: hypothetical protein JNK21_02850 [Rhodospirillaceae bacterium]|nr:hypothetical protein [Rhodospirillaceae bacterium]
MAKTTKEQSGSDSRAIAIELSAALVAVHDEAPKILLVRDQGGDSATHSQFGLPCGPFDPVAHRTLEEGLRTWVGEQSGIQLGYAEQLYTFGDRFRDPQERKGGPRPVSVGYLALVRQTDLRSPENADWSDWYRHFPWEDWRSGPPAIVSQVIGSELKAWADAPDNRADRARRRERIDTTFGLGDMAWDNERVLERYELLYEAGLIAETVTDGRERANPGLVQAHTLTGAVLIKDHRRIMATAMGRLRAKIKYRPVIFELMPPNFTLYQLQRAAEALAGARLHKQNFRRLVANEGLVEATGQISSQTGGRPAELFRFRRDVVRERPASGVRLSVRVKPKK